MARMNIIEAKDVKAGDQLLVNIDAFGPVRVKKVQEIELGQCPSCSANQAFYFRMDDAYTLKAFRCERLVIVEE